MTPLGPKPPPDDGAVGRFVANALTTIGLLITVLAGLCTGAVVIMGLPDLIAGRLDYGELMLPLLFGGIPIAVGVALIFIGRALRRPVPKS